MKVKTNFLQTPNKAFEMLTNEFDLVGYQKLLREIGINNIWVGGNRALAAKLGTSYGRVVKLKKKLQEVGFIEILPGDNAHGESDKWKMVDIFDYRMVEDTLSRNEQGLSPNEPPLSRNGQDIGIISSVPNGTGETPSQDCLLSAADRISVGQIIWTNGIELLRITKKPEQQIRSFLGKLAKQYGNDLLAQCISITIAKNPVNPQEFLVKSLDFQKKLLGGGQSEQPKFNTSDLQQAENAFLAQLKLQGATANV